MAKKVFTDKQKRLAVLRVTAGKEDTKEVARELGVVTRTIERWCEEAGVPLSRPVVPASESGESAEVGKSSESLSPEMQEALQDGGASPGASETTTGKATVSAGEIALAQKLKLEKDEEFCISTVTTAKVVPICMLAPLVGLDPTSPEVQKLFPMLPQTEEAIKANAPAFARKLRELMKSEDGELMLVWLMLAAEVVVTGFGGVMLWLDKREAAKEAKEKAKKEREARAAQSTPAAPNQN